MAQKSIREYDAKRLIATSWEKYFDGAQLKYNFRSHIVHFPDIITKDTEKKLKWLSSPLVTKPDELFGKRGKNNLVLVNKKLDQSKSWINQKSAQITTLLSGQSGTLKNFIVEPFVQHTQEEEYYLSFETAREDNIINVSKAGGVDIEQNWDTQVTTITAPIWETTEYLARQLGILGYNKLHIDFITQMYQLFCDLDFCYLEFNPYVIQGEEVFLLDCVAKVDDTARFLHIEEWKNLEFPKSFDSLEYTKEELLIETLDSMSGASLKLRMLHPDGDIYPLFSGGGASVVMMDLIATEIGAQRLALYGEYSGNPTQEETKQYTQAVIDLMVRNNPTSQPRVLLVVGAIANFTDVYKTFLGIVDALESNIEALTSFPLTVIVRRGGPNSAQALTLIQSVCDKLGLPCKTYSHYTQLHEIVQTLSEVL